MSDEPYLPSSPSTVYSLALDYEQSQHKQEIREAREAEMSPEELSAAAEQRCRKRVKLGLESPNYKREEFSPPIGHVPLPKLEAAMEGSKSPARTPRASAVQAIEKTCKCVAYGCTCFWFLTINT
jgi:hypothetical protein